MPLPLKIEGESFIDLSDNAPVTLPANWGIQSTSNATYFDISLLEGNRLESKLAVDVKEESSQEVVYTWSGLAVMITHQLRSLSNTVKMGHKDQILLETGKVVECVEVMFHVSNTDDPLVLSNNQRLKRDHFQIVRLLSSLINCAKLCSTVWPPPEANLRMAQVSHDLLQAVQQYTTEASISRIPVQYPTAEQLTKIKEDAQSKFTRYYTASNLKENIEIMNRLELLALEMVNISQDFGIEEIQSGLTSNFPIDHLFNLGQLFAECVGKFLVMIDELSLDSLFPEIIIDFKVNRLTLFNCLTELVVLFRNVNETHNWSLIFVYVELVMKSSKELLISAKFLVDEKENLEASTVKEYIENHSSPAPSTAKDGLRIAASYSLGRQQNARKNSLDNRYSFLPIDPVKKERVTSNVYSTDTGSSLADRHSIERQSYNSTMFAKYRRFSRRESLPENDGLLKPDYSNKTIVFDGKQVKEATIDAMIAYMTSHTTTDEEFIQDFLLTYRVILTSTEFVDKLEFRFMIQEPEDLSPEDAAMWKESKQRRIRLKVYQVLKEWLEHHVHDDEIDRQVVFKIANFAKGRMEKDMPASSQALMKLVGNVINSEYKPVKIYDFLSPKVPPRPIITHNLQKVRTLDIDAQELARQLTIIDNQQFIDLDPVELLLKAWKVPNVATLAIDRLLQSSKRVSSWISLNILQISDPKKRVKAIGYFIAVANWSASLNNFHTTMSILNSLHSFPISRLSKTWSLLNSKYSLILQALRDLTVSDRNFANYRQALMNAEPPAIPNITLYMADLRDIKPFVPIDSENLINFAGLSRCAVVLKQCDGFKGKYSLEEVPELQSFLKSEFSNDVSEEELIKLSMQIESSSAVMESEKYKNMVANSGLF